MNDEIANEPEAVAPEVVAELDNFDLSTPAEAEARRQVASQEEPDDNVQDPVVDDEVEAKAETEPKTETPEPTAYQAPQKVQQTVPKFEGEIPVDEYGNIDPKGLAEYMQKFSEHAIASAQVEANNAYYENVHGQREWSDVGEAYPELVKNESTRSLIENLRVADAIRGGKGELMEAARQIKGLQDTARTEGQTSQQSSITRQKSVALQTSSRQTTPNANTNSNLRQRAMGGGADSESARIALLSNLYDSGALNS